MSEEEREILRASRRKAMEVLTASSAEAERVADEAEADALALLLEQQRLAERVLHEQEAASESARAAGETGDPAEGHRAAADLLADAQQEVAAKLQNTQTNAGVDVLMAGQREAAAILLDAWMQVMEGRPPDGERSG